MNSYWWINFRFFQQDVMFTPRVAVILFLLVVCLIPSQMALAHGGGQLQISNAPVGQYQVSVWSAPPTARAGRKMHVTVGIAQADTGEPVLDAAVAITVLSNKNGETVATAIATTAQAANRLFYETDLDGIAIGRYEVLVEVTGNEGSGVLTFPLSVEPVPLWPWLAGAAAVGAVFWLVLNYWRKGTQIPVSRRRTAVSRPYSID